MKKFKDFNKNFQLLLIKKTLEMGYGIDMLVCAVDFKNSEREKNEYYTGSAGTWLVDTGKSEGFAINISKAESMSEFEILSNSEAASKIGLIGGKKKSKEKSAAARKNGKLGGRPKKLTKI